MCSVGCANTSTSISSRLAFYSFDSTTNDATGVYSASGIASPIYTTGYVNSAISFDASLLQRLSAPAMSLNSRSFTIEFWFSLTDSASYNYAFFGQLSVPNTERECLFLVSTFGKLYMGFFDNDTPSSTILQNNTWYHAAFVYDNDIRQRFIYLNGILDAQSATGVGPYLGTTGSMTIGGANVDGTIGKPYFSGYIDELMVYTRARTACEILNDATLSAYFPFDGSFTDSGPNSVPLTSSGASFITGYTNQGISFWVYPTVKGVLVHVSANSSGRGWCTPFITFSSTGVLVTQVYSGGASITLNGPSLITTGWTHIIQTFSPNNGQRVYINGYLYTSTIASNMYTASGTSDYVTIGNMLDGTGYCANPSTVLTVFQGGIDELRIYGAELSSIDACLLAQS
jgi:hypothetical protein